MLVLSRKAGQELIIGDSIRITVNRVGGSRVTLGISAPDDVRIVRGELAPVIESFDGETEEAEGSVDVLPDESEASPPLNLGADWDTKPPFDFRSHVH